MSTPQPLPPDELAAGLADVYQVVGPLYRKVLRVVEREQPVMGMSVGARAVLDQLRRGGPMTVPQLARGQDLSRQFVQRMVDEARAADWVEPRDNPAHRRSHLIHLRPDGVAAIDAVHERERLLMGRVGGELTGPEVEATLRVLRAMLGALDGVEREQSVRDPDSVGSASTPPE